MYIDHTTSLRGHVPSEVTDTAKPADTSANPDADTIAAAKKIYFAGKHDNELLPAFRETARAVLMFHIMAEKISTILKQFADAGYIIEISMLAPITSQDVARLARGLVLAGLIAVTDDILDGVDLTV
jgi:hypothetical protein